MIPSNTLYLEKCFALSKDNWLSCVHWTPKIMDFTNNGLVPLAPYWPVLMDFPSPLSYATEVTASPQNYDTVTSLFCFLWGE